MPCAVLQTAISAIFASCCNAVWLLGANLPKAKVPFPAKFTLPKGSVLGKKCYNSSETENSVYYHQAAALARL